MTRCAVTLIELLLVISLMLVLGGLVLPNVFTGMRQRAFEATGETVRSQLLLARAHAQATGRPVEVIYAGDAPRVEARYFTAESLETTHAVEPAVADEQGVVSWTVQEASEVDPAEVIVEGWASRALPDGLHITDVAPDEVDGSAAPSDREVPGPEPDLLRLTVFMPDGSALLGRPVWIRDGRGRLGRLSVNAWTGLASFEGRAAAPDDEALAEQEQQEQDEQETQDEVLEEPTPREPPPPTPTAEQPGPEVSSQDAERQGSGEPDEDEQPPGEEAP